MARFEFTQKLADEICNRISNGESLRAICEDKDKPSKSLVLKWLDGNEEFRDQYARARSDQADTYFDEIIKIADDEPDSNKARVRIDARKWVAGKLKPKKYGDKVDHNHTGQLAINILRFADDQPAE